MEQLTSFLSPDRIDGLLAMGLNVVAAIIIFIIGSWISKKVKKLIVAMAKKSPHLDETLFNFLGSIARWLIMAVVLMACLLYTSPSPRDKRQSRMPSSA